jgi:hypothetical protein
MKSANQHVLMSAIAYNLKKLMKFNRQKTKIVAASLQKVCLQAGELFHFLIRPSQSF